MSALTGIIRDRQEEETSLAALVRDSYANGVAEQRDDTAAKSASSSFSGRDTVAISGEGRARLRADEGKNRVMGAVAGSGMRVNGSGEEEPVDETTRLKQSIMKQIKEVKKKLQEAQQRLSETASKVGDASGTNNAQAAPEAGLAATVQAAPGMGGTEEAEAVRQEVTQLQAQLQELYNQLQQLTRSGGSGGAGGTAGIGGGSNGPSGQGERIAVTA